MTIIYYFIVLFLLANTLKCQLSYETALTGPGRTNGWDGDLGVPFIYNNRYYFLEGDVLHQSVGRIPNAIGSCTDISRCMVQWNEISGGSPYPFYYLLGKSTVPAGAITLRNIAYIFMMNVVDWGNGAPGSVIANSLGIKGIPPTPFAPTSIKYGDDSKFVNIAPVLSPDGETVYLFGSGKYRAAPISLAAVPAASIEDISAVKYFSGTDNNEPVWTTRLENANPVIRGGVGELSAIWSSYKNQYLVSYFDFQPNGASVLRLANSSNPWGPFDINTILFDSSVHYPWMEPGWYGPYGGYIVPDGGNKSPILYITLSLWVPYRVFLLSFDLGKILPTMVAL